MGKEDLKRAKAMEDAADGYADDEMVLFEGVRYSGWRLRDMAEEIYEAMEDNA